MHVGTLELPDKLRVLSDGATGAAQQVGDLVEGSAAAVKRTARAARKGKLGRTRVVRRTGARSLALWAVLFVVAVVASRWWSRRNGPGGGGDVPSGPPPEVAARVERATPAPEEVDTPMA